MVVVHNSFDGREAREAETLFVPYGEECPRCRLGHAPLYDGRPGAALHEPGCPAFGAALVLSLN